MGASTTTTTNLGPYGHMLTTARTQSTARTTQKAASTNTQFGSFAISSLQKQAQAQAVAKPITSSTISKHIGPGGVIIDTRSTKERNTQTQGTVPTNTLTTPKVDATTPVEYRQILETLTKKIDQQNQDIAKLKQDATNLGKSSIDASYAINEQIKIREQQRAEDYQILEEKLKYFKENDIAIATTLNQLAGVTEAEAKRLTEVVQKAEKGEIGSSTGIAKGFGDALGSVAKFGLGETMGVNNLVLLLGTVLGGTILLKVIK